MKIKKYISTIIIVRIISIKIIGIEKINKVGENQEEFYGKRIEGMELHEYEYYVTIEPQEQKESYVSYGMIEPQERQEGNIIYDDSCKRIEQRKNRIARMKEEELEEYSRKKREQYAKKKLNMTEEELEEYNSK